MGIVGTAAAAGIGISIAAALKNRRHQQPDHQPDDTDPPLTQARVDTGHRNVHGSGHRVYANRVEMEDDYDYESRTFDDEDFKRGSDLRGHITVPAHVDRHPRYGHALQRLSDNPTVSRAHLRALINHIDHLMRAQYALETLKTTDSSKVARAASEVSYRRSKVMRRVVRLAYATKIPMLPDSNRVMDDSIQECLDEIRKATDDALHNTHLSSMDKFEASVYEQ